MNDQLTWDWVESFCKIKMCLYSDIKTRTTTFTIQNKKLNDYLVIKSDAEYVYNHYIMQLISGEPNILKRNIQYYLKHSSIKDIFGEIIYE